MDHRFPIAAVAGVAAAALFIGHMATQVLPAELAGLSTSVLVVLGMVGSVAAAIRWL